MTKVVFQLLTTRSLNTRDDGQIIFGLWKKHLPDLLPDKFGNYEPIRKIFDPTNFEPALDAWRWPFLAVKKQPRLECSIWMRRSASAVHSNWGIIVDKSGVQQESFVNLLKEASVVLDADFACVHPLEIPEIERGVINGTISFLNQQQRVIWMKADAQAQKQIPEFTFLLSTQKFKRCIPDLYWATVFGRPYIEMFGRDRLVSTPVETAQPIKSGHVLLQLSRNIHEMEDSWMNLQAVRETAKAHLGRDSFCDSGITNVTSRCVPAFNL